jgi:hypothetical protein
MPPSKSTYAVAAMPDQSDQGRDQKANEAGPARLFALCAGGFLALLGVLGFFFDAGFETGKQLSADDVAGIIVVNGWRNVLYLVTGLLALGFAARRPRRTSAVLGGFYLLLGLWGVAETDHDIGNILEVLPLTDEDNVLHLVIGGLGAIAALADRPLPSLPRRKPKPKRRRASSRSRA